VLELADWSGEIDLARHAPDKRLELLDRDQVDVAVISLSPALGVDELPEDERRSLTAAYEDGILELGRELGGRLAPLGVFETQQVDAFPGVCAPASLLLAPDAVAPRLDELERAKKVLFVHPGPAEQASSGPSWWAEVVDYTAQMQRAYASWLAHGAGRWPALNVVFAILAGGAPFQVERLGSRGVEARETLHENVYLETSSYGRRALELCLATFGVRQLVYGSDVPVIDSKQTLDAVRGFGDPVADALCRENPARLLA
jgi:6-methylsalicylate decarboxylase